MPWLQYMHPHAWGCGVLFLCVRDAGGTACVRGSISAAGAQAYEEWGARQCLPGDDTQLNPNFKGVVEEIGTAVHFLHNRARFSTAVCRWSSVFFLFYLLGNKPVNPWGSGNTVLMNPASLPLPPWAPHSRLRSDPQHLGPVPLSPGIPSPAPWGGPWAAEALHEDPLPFPHQILSFLWMPRHFDHPTAGRGCLFPSPFTDAQGPETPGSRPQILSFCRTGPALLPRLREVWRSF